MCGLWNCGFEGPALFMGYAGPSHRNHNLQRLDSYPSSLFTSYVTWEGYYTFFILSSICVLVA